MPLRSPIALVAALLLPFALALAAPVRPAAAGDFTDAAGRHLRLPEAIGRVMPAERNAEVLVYVLAPDKLAGLELGARRGALPRGGYLPVLEWGLRSTPAQMAATARQLMPDLIVDAGAVTPERAAFADEVQRLTGIPYILVDDSFSRMPPMLRSMGALLGVEHRADNLATYADHAISRLRGRLLIVAANSRPRVYFALGPDGLTTALPGSPAGAAIDEAGAINVAGSLGSGGEARVTPGQLLAWDPAIVIAEGRGVYDALRRDWRWRGLAAVREKHVYLEPTHPFGWIEDPSGVNRLIGLNWLSAVLYPAGTQKDVQSDVCNFYDKFYRIKLTNAEVTALAGPAGVPPEQGVDALIGLGTMPPAPLPGYTPPAPSAATTIEPPAAAGGAQASAATSPSAMTGVPGLPNTAPGAPCTIPEGPSPQPLPGLEQAPSSTAPGIAPGVPPPGRRGRPNP